MVEIIPDQSKSTIGEQLRKSLSKIIGEGIELDKLPLLEKKGYRIHEKIIGRGGENKVYLLENTQKKKSLVIKISVMSMFDNSDDAFYKAKRLREKFELIKKHWGEYFIPDERMFISKINKRGRLAIITVQEFFGDDIKDIFKEILNGTFQKIVSKDQLLKKDFLLFVEKLLEWKDLGLFIDLYGSKNLIIIRDKNNRSKIKFIDSHFLLSSDDFLSLNSEANSLLYHSILSRVGLLEKMYNKIRENN